MAGSKQALKTSNYPIYCVRETEPDYSTILGSSLRINGPIARFSIVVMLCCVATSNAAKLAWPRWREVAAQHNSTSTGGCSYSFVYS